MTLQAAKRRRISPPDLSSRSIKTPATTEPRSLCFRRFQSPDSDEIVEVEQRDLELGPPDAENAYDDIDWGRLSDFCKPTVPLLWTGERSWIWNESWRVQGYADYIVYALCKICFCKRKIKYYVASSTSGITRHLRKAHSIGPDG